MTDKIRQAAEECAEKIYLVMTKYTTTERWIGIEIESAMRELLTAHPEASSSVRLDGETHCVSESPTPAPTIHIGKNEIETFHEQPGHFKSVYIPSPTPASEEELAQRLAEHICGTPYPTVPEMLPIIRAYVAELEAILPDVEHEEAEAEALRQQSDYFQSEVDAATERERMLVEALRECVQSMAAATNVTFGCLPKARVTLALFDQPVAPKEPR